MAKKLIISIESALKIKYRANFPTLNDLLEELVRADAFKGLITSIIYIDRATTAERYNYPLPLKFDQKTCKDIIDHIYSIEQSAYLAIFGAQDVFPFQDLANQLYKPQGGDPDEFIQSDWDLANRLRSC